MGMSSACFEVTPDMRWVVSTHGRYTLIRDLTTGRLSDEWDTGYHGLDFGTMALCDNGKAVLRSSTVTGLERRELARAPSGEIIFGDRRQLDPEPGFFIVDHAAGGHRLAMVNPATGGVKIMEIQGNGAKVLSRWITPAAYSAALSPDGERVLLNCAALGTNAASFRIRVHRVSDGSVVNELTAPVSCDAVWSANGKTAMTSNGQKQSIIWDAANWQPTSTLSGVLGGDVTTFVLSQDGSYAVVCHDTRISLVSTAKGEVLATFDSPSSSGFAAGARFSPDGRTFAVMWRDGRIDLFSPDAVREALKPLGLAW
jgi:WD40 repeat protein